MTIVVETGSGLSSADSYGEVADVDSYNESYVYSSAWRRLDPAARERAARQATQFIDLNYGAFWRGTKKSSSQSLDWPRINVTDNEGYAVDSTVVPESVKKAFYELCIRAATTELMPDVAAEDSGTLVESEVRVGSIIDKSVFAGGQGQEARFTRIDRLLRPLMIRLDSIERG